MERMTGLEETFYKLIFASTGSFTSLPLASGKELGSRTWPQSNLKNVEEHCVEGDFLLFTRSVIKNSEWKQLTMLVLYHVFPGFLNFIPQTWHSQLDICN